ncbi:FecR family protein [Phenylobacterium sp.]|jgi:transmembrane sensor|uniref:FecR family protein n=1 Tax=Phenylobacterium sp. TaxID=1871053 RepID=UPI0037848308
MTGGKTLTLTLDAAADDAARWAARLSDGPLSTADEADLRGWLDADPANGDAMEATIDAWRVVDDYASSPEVVRLREAALASARRTRRRGEFRRLARRRLPWVLLAACVPLVVGLLAAWFWYTPTAYETHVGERRVVALSDGSKVSMDASTLVKVRLRGRSRELWLERGRAKFDVAKDPLRPFSVAAAGKVVVATGTSFSVELLRREVRVVLYEGQVALLSRDAAGAPRTERLGLPNAPRLQTSGEQAIAAADATATAVAPFQLTSVDPVRSLSWEAGQLIFEDEPLGLAVERFNRHAAKPIEVDPKSAQVRISGVFEAGDTMAFLQGLSVAFGFGAVETSNAIVLTTAG